MGKKKKDRKGKGAEKTAQKTEMKAEKKMKKILKEKGEVCFYLNDSSVLMVDQLDEFHE